MTLTFAIAVAGAVMSAASLVLHALAAKSKTAATLAADVDAAQKLLPKV